MLHKSLILTVVVTVLTLIHVQAQEGGQAQGGEQARPGRRRPTVGAFTPERLAERMVERQKDGLKVTDDEWTVIQPLLSKVTTLQMQERIVRGGAMMMGGGRRVRPQEQTQEIQTQMAQIPGYLESQALKEVLEKQDSTAAEIQEKLDALRNARKAADEELKKAREDLRQVLTLKQEAQLTMQGVLD